MTTSRTRTKRCMMSDVGCMKRVGLTTFSPTFFIRLRCRFLQRRIMERVKNFIVNVTKGIKMTFVEIEESLKNEKL